MDDEPEEVTADDPSKVLRTLNLDGTLHAIPGRENCNCRTFGKDCRKCGGFVHFQPVYGGIAYVCEDCGGLY